MEDQNGRTRAAIQPENGEEASWDNLVEEIRGITGYDFRNPDLLRQAFTDHSYLYQEKNSTASYQRLEYVGDAVLGFFMATDHYSMYPELSAGQLTKLRSANVDCEKLARAALKHRLHRFLRHNKPLLAGQIKQFEGAMVNYPVHSFGLIDAPKALADIVESLVGAVHIDCNSIDTTFQVIENLLQPMITPATLSTHPVTMLYEICQKHKVTIEVRSDTWRETGLIEFVLGGELVGRAVYKGKRLIAYTRAAHEAYNKFVAKLQAG